jgi:copper homeostasis protein
MSPIFEIAIESLQSAIIAEKAGAKRVELCAALSEGGITPSHGMIKSVCEKSNLDVFVIIRPRGGDFLYSDEEFEIMCLDIVAAKKLGADGIVSGALTTEGAIDMEKTQKMLELCHPLPFTFHRAFDRCNEPFVALEQLIDLGVARILSSGQVPSAEHGTDLLGKLVKQADGRIIIMPGAGVNSENITDIVAKTGASEFHLSGKRPIASNMKYVRAEMDNGKAWHVMEADLEEISLVIKKASI